MADKIEDPYKIQRGNYSTNWPGTSILVAWRLFSPAVNYMILTGTTSLPSLRSLPGVPLTTSQGLLLAMPSYLAFKHITWLLFLMREPMSTQFAFFGGIADLLFEATTAYVFTKAPRNPLWAPEMVYIGAAINFIGITTELVSEIQRSRFKKDPKNEGKLYTRGAWGLARNVNYGCNVVFSFGYGLAAGGPLYAVFYSGIYVCNFVFNAIPSFEEYMKGKYGEQWIRMTKQVPWRLIPGIY